MTDYRRIMVATDFSEASANALDHAAVLADRYDAELHIVHVQIVLQHTGQPEDFPGLEQLEAALTRVAGKELEALKPHFDGRVERVTLRDYAPAPSILHYAEENAVDLIVMGSHARRGLSHALLGSQAESVARQAKVPVLVVGRGSGHELTADGIQVIVAPVDFSEHSAGALRHAALLARQHQARLLAVHVMEEMVLPPYYPNNVLGPVRREHGLAALEKYLEPLELAVTPEPVVSLGQTHRQIAEEAGGHHAGLIVMATSGMSRLERALMGSVTNRVLRLAPCPVLVYHER
jgi:nucleotide-binding universal stress UspA family protein